MSRRRLLTIALIIGLPGISQAQFTTFIAPRNKSADSVKTVVVAQQKAKVDSSVKTQLTNMKTWVDSAAGLPPRSVSSAATDSLAATIPPPLPATRLATRPTAPPAATPTVPPQLSARDTTTFANGARAPSTATDLPTLLVLGGLLVFVGATLAGATPKPERVRAHRTRESSRTS